MKHERQRFPFLRLGDILKATEDYLRPLLLLLRCPEPRSRAGSSLGVRGLSSVHPVELSAWCRAGRRAGSHTPLSQLPFTRGTRSFCQDPLCFLRVSAPPECPALSHLPSAIGKKPRSSHTVRGGGGGTAGPGAALDVFRAGKRAAGLGLGPPGLGSSQ